ncbi:hypothetical protein SAMN04488065_2059 [Haloplanus vescus]|uniref:Uncharacterized protein n=1 Tax=Haloplanus vescus TaxID=555874 RepID=A0A1H3Z0H0_9EURY|nr:DUF5784 family protein [Haloplanus vescus]SEA17150.1 hypothetical protein SAMN04488065_2059 [Haloplanus vescus]
MARPLRFRHAPGRWTEGRVRAEVFEPLDDNLGATSSRPWFKPPEGYEARRFDVDNGDTALFCWTDGEAYWLGNTETPSSLWRTEKYGFTEVPTELAEWAERELQAELHEQSPWLADYPHLSWFFLPVFLSKDGRETTREFFEEHAAGFPDANRDDALAFYESFLSTGVLDDDRELMAGKLGTSEQLDLTRMAASMGEFHTAKLLVDMGYDVEPEIEVSTGHSIDFQAQTETGEQPLVEVTRPLPPNRRSAGTPVAAVRDTAQTKTSGQLSAHAGGVVLFVDCSSFPDDDWLAVAGERPDVGHRPAVVYRIRPDGRVEGYTKGSVPLELGSILD